MERVPHRTVNPDHLERSLADGHHPDAVEKAAGRIGSAASEAVLHGELAVPHLPIAHNGEHVRHRHRAWLRGNGQDEQTASSELARHLLGAVADRVYRV